MRAVLVAAALAVACNSPAASTTKSVEPGHDASRAVASAEAELRTAGPSVPGAVKIVAATDDTDTLTLIRTRRLEAKAEGRVLVVYVGATWCEPCKRFKTELASGRLDERLSRVSLLTFDADKDGDRLASAGYRYAYVPFVALPGADGHPQEHGQASGKGSEAWRELLAKLDAWQR